MLYERLKSTDYISHEGDLLRLVRYVMEDGKTPLPINHYFLMRDSVYTILEKAIGRVLTKEEYDTGLNEAKSTLSVHSDIIKHEFQTRRIENFDMDTLSNILAFLEICLSSRQLLCLCISLYERHKEIDNYSVNAFKNILIWSVRFNFLAVFPGHPNIRIVLYEFTTESAFLLNATLFVYVRCILFIYGFLYVFFNDLFAIGCYCSAGLLWFRFDQLLSR